MDIKVVPVRDFVIVYNGESNLLDEKRSGRWICFAKDSEQGAETAKTAVKRNIVPEAKYMRSGAGPVSFFLNADEKQRHRALLSWMLEKGLLPRDREGKLRDMQFVPDRGAVIGRDLHLSDILDLESEELKESFL